MKNVNDKEILPKLRQHAFHMRKTALKIAYQCGKSTHLGGGLSLMEMLAVLYGGVMNCADLSLPYAERDKFILSKGHGVLGLYAALAEFGVLSDDDLQTFLQDGSDLIAHPVMKPEIGLEASSGSLGQGISIAAGLALAAKKKGYKYKTYVICGNGECNEGSVWEACMSAVNFQLDNFTLLIDNNHMQSDGNSEAIMDVSDKYTSMLKSLGFQTFEVDGHDVAELYSALMSPANGKPKAIVCHTIKGKGVPFMEGDNNYHHSRLTETQYIDALAGLEADV